MYAKGLALCVFVIVSVGFDGSDGSPRPCPQFLPVVVRMESSRTPYHLKTSIKVKDDKENLIYDDPVKAAPILTPSDLLLPKVSEKPITTPTTPPENKLTKQKKEEKSKEPKLLQISSIVRDNVDVTRRPLSQRPKKRRRSRPKASRIILDPNTAWALKTINDKPAAEVLVTDKASVARDLKDATESALIDVKKLED